MEIPTKKIGRPRKQKLPAKTTVVTRDSIGCECTTRTFIAKHSNVTPVTISYLLEKVENCYTTKFRNCVLVKFNKASAKIYTNLTVQITGITLVDEAVDIIRALTKNITVDVYTVYCVMSNWTVSLGRNVDLVSTMNRLNDNGFVSYFLRGYPLINKIPSKFERELFVVTRVDGVLGVSTVSKETVEKEISILIFKSGNCIASGPSEKPCAESLYSILEFLEYAEQ